MQELMKKRIYLLFLLLIYSWTFIGCHNEQKEEKLNDGLICFTETGKEGESLKGVKRLADGKILVEPAPYESVTADSCFIIARKSAYSLEVWKTDGTRIGLFDTFTGFGGRYYIGTKYKTTCYYFPRYNVLVCSEQVKQGVHVVCLKTEDGWEVRSYEGELVWQGTDEPDLQAVDKQFVTE